MARQIALDTETTGLEPKEGHRIIEIGCVELIDRRLTGNHFHQYLNPEREIDAGALSVHGLSNQFLQDKPIFSAILKDFLEFIDGAELVIHNAPFDVGFMQHELRLAGHKPFHIKYYCQVIDTLQLARKKHPGQRNSLDALCKRYRIDNSHRQFHGALLDAEILSQVYLAMTGGQTSFFADYVVEEGDNPQYTVTHAPVEQHDLIEVLANDDELQAHKAYCQMLTQETGDEIDW